ncbi:hypothetical protein RB195_015879 [Necator americanus]|uniref:Uridine 5'-monophosphate synthase n=1 Tax=Necator americanus TaxID=51031 RepID=A0ABR1E778_NECAM
MTDFIERLVPYELVDIGANLGHPSYKDDLDSVLKRAKQAGLSKVMLTGTCEKISAECKKLAETMPGFLYFTAGVHPHDAKDFNGNTLNTLRVLQSHKQCVAVGECGLDFNRNFSPQDVQRDVFEKQVELACELNKPLFIHEREAHEDMVRILSNSGESLPPTVIHCFTGTEEEAKKYVEMGLHIGLTGFLWKDRQPNGVQAALRNGVIPLDRLLIETDAPFMYPKINDKKLPVDVKEAISDSAKELHKFASFNRNEPCALPAICEMIAAFMGKDPKELCIYTMFFLVFALCYVMNLLVEQSLNGARQRNLLRSMLNSKVFKFGEFVLKSGQKSPIYIDLRECFGYADLMSLASDGLKSLIVGTDIEFDAIVGVPYAALPYATLVSYRESKPLIIIRKEAKTHGTKKLIEGLYKKGDKVIVIEDVVTTGGSIQDVVDILRDEGLVVEDVFCLLDREQGGAEKLEKHGITLHSLMNMETVLSFLLSVEAIDKETCSKIVSALNLPCQGVKHLPLSLEMENLAKFPLHHLGRLPLEERAKEAICPLNKKIFSLMLKKNSNLCLAVDYTSAEKILQLVEKAAPFVVAIKVHADAITDFSEDFTSKLVRLANDHEFVIFEDRKFGDTGNTNILQLKGAQRIAEWADIVTVHAVQGSDSIGSIFRQIIADPAYRLSGILLIAQLSTKGSLTALPGYAEAAAEMGGANRDVVCGFICQTRVSTHPDMLHWTPGVNLDATSDNAGQQWRGLDEAVKRQQNDIVIVGRGVTASSTPIQELTRYREAAWTALTAKS